jgi:hypothetical protein
MQNDDTKPVPKEDTSKTNLPNNTSASTQTISENQPSTVNQPDSANASSDIQPTPNTPQPTPSAQQPVSDETPKKKKGFCNFWTCLLAGCGGCFIVVIVLVILAIFAAPFLADSLNKLINSGVDVPEYSEVDVEDKEDQLEQIKDGKVTKLVLTEDELNTIIKNNRKDSQDATLGAVETLIDLEKDSADVFFKFTDWMPWAILNIEGNDEGTTEFGSMKLGTFDIGDFAQSQVDDYSSTDANANPFLTSLIFGGDANSVTVETIYLFDDKIEITFLDTSMDYDELENYLE